MSFKRRMKRERKVQKFKSDFGSSLEVDGDLPHDAVRAAAAYFDDMSGPLEPITDELIAELVIKNGWEEKRLRESQAMGMKYSRKRNSFWQ